MKEFFQSLFDSSKERIKSPLVGSYITSFILFNWRPISIYLFSNDKIESRIQIINDKYCLAASLLWPLAIAIFYVLILPYLNLGFDWLLNKANTAKTEKQKNIKIKNLEQKVTEADLERKIADKRAGASEVDSLKGKIDVLERENAIRSQEITDVMERHNNELAGMKNRYDQICVEKEKIETEYNNIVNGNSRFHEVYNLLISQNNDLSARNIKIYFRSLRDSEFILSLKKRAEDSTVASLSLPFSAEYSALLLKAKVFIFDETKKLYLMTEEGRKFIQDID